MARAADNLNTAIPEQGIEGEYAVREAAAGDFHDIMALLRDALKAKRGLPDCEFIHLESVYVDHVVVRDGARYWRYDYSIGDDNQVQLGEPREVTKTFIDATMREAAGPFLEAKDNSGLRFRIRVIRAGRSGNNNYYPDAVLREATPLFNGVRVFVKADEEHLAGKGKSFSNLIGRLTDAAFVEGKKTDGGEIQATLELLESAQGVSAKIREAHARGMSDIFGFSIDASGPMKKRGKMREAVAFRKVDSVDLIIEPGAGGQIINFIEALNNDEDPDMKLRERMLEAIKKADPERHAELDREDVTEEQILEAYREAMGENSTSGDDGRKSGGGDGAAAGTGVTHEEVDAAVRLVEARAEARAEIAESGLPEPAKDKLRTRFAEATEIKDGDIKEAIEAEADYLARFTESGRVKGLGGDSVIEGGEDQAEKTEKMLEALFDPKAKGIRSIKEAYGQITGDVNVTGRLENCDPRRMREALGTDRSFREAIDSSTFAQVLGDAIRRAMIADYNLPSVYDVWRRIANAVPVSDFRTNHRTRIGGYGDIPTVGEAGAYGALASPTDEEMTYSVTKRGGTEEITLETVKNDDMGVVQRIPRKLSRAALRTLAKFVLDFIKDNPTIYDGKALFHADHNNLGSAALDATSLAARRLAMLQQTELGSNDRLGIPARSLLVPTDQEETAFDLFRRQTNNDTDFIESLQLDVLPVWYWDDPNDWALAADPNDIPTIEIGFLDGNEEPELFVQDNPTVGSLFSHDKITYKIRHIYGGNVEDFRGLQKAVVA